MTNTTRINFVCPPDLYAVIRAELATQLTANPQGRINQSTIVIDALRAALMPEIEPSESDSPKIAAPFLPPPIIQE